MKQVFNPLTSKPDFIVDADDVAKYLYSIGCMVVVVGPKLIASDPPTPSLTTTARINRLVALGIPTSYIGWSVVGEESDIGSTGTFTAPTVTLWPQISAPTLNGLQSGGFALPGVTLQPQISAPTLVGLQAGNFALPTVTLQPSISAPSLDGVQAGVGVFALPAVTLQPQVAAPTLVGVQVGAFVVPAVSLQPQVSAPSLAGLQVGSFAVPAVSLRPVVTTPTLAASIASNSGTFTLPAVSLQPTVTAPTLTGVSSGSATIAENFDTAIALTYSAPGGYPSDMATTATVQGWTIASSGTDPGTFAAYDTFVGASVGTGAVGFSGNGLVVAGCRTEDVDSNVLARSGYKVSKTWSGPFASGTFSIKYKVATGSAVNTIKINGVSVGALTQNNAWQTATISLTSPANILLEIECAPTTNQIALAPQIVIDSITYS